MDKVRLHREALKRAWFNMDHSNTPVRKEIIITYRNNPHWPGYGEVKMIRDEPGSYSSFSSHQKDPMQYVKDRIKDSKGCPYRDLSEFKIIIKDLRNETNK